LNQPGTTTDVQIRFWQIPSGTRISTSDIGRYIFFVVSGSFIVGIIETHANIDTSLPINVIYNSENIDLNTGPLTVEGFTFGISTDQTYPAYGYPSPSPSTQTLVAVPTQLTIEIPVPVIGTTYNLKSQLGWANIPTANWGFSITTADIGKTIHILTTTGYKIVATIDSFTTASLEIPLNIKKQNIPTPLFTDRYKISQIFISSYKNYTIDLFPTPVQITRREVTYSSGPTCTRTTNGVIISISSSPPAPGSGAIISLSDIGSFIFFFTNNNLIVGRIGQFPAFSIIFKVEILHNEVMLPSSVNAAVPIDGLTFGISTDMNFPSYGFTMPPPPTTVPAPIGAPGPAPRGPTPAPIGSPSPAPRAPPPAPLGSPGPAPRGPTPAPIPIWLEITFPNTLQVVVYTERAGSEVYYEYSLQYSPDWQFRFWGVTNLSVSDTGKTVHILTDTGDKVVATLGTIDDMSKKIELNFKRTTIPNPPEGSTTRHKISRILISSLTDFSIDLFLSLVPPPGQRVPPPCPAHSLTNNQNIDDMQEVQIFTFGGIGFRIEPDGNCYQVRIGPDNPTSVMVSEWTNNDPNLRTYTHVEAAGILFEIINWGTHYLTAYTNSPVPITTMVRTAEIYMYRPAPPPPPGMVPPAPFGGGTPPGMVPPAPVPGMVPPAPFGPSSLPPGMVPPAPFGGTPLVRVPPPPSQIVAPSVPPSAPFRQTMVTPVITFTRSGDRSISVKYIYKSDGTGYRHVSNQDGSYSEKGPFFTYTAQGQKIFITYTGNAIRTVSEVQPAAGSEPV
jgi:hypothetical protein